MEATPAKRRRLTPPPAAPPVALVPVPAPVALLAVAVSLRASAQALLPSLARRPRPDSTSSHTRYSQAWAEYTRAATAAVVTLRAAVRLAATHPDYAGGRIELRAAAMLAETLVDVYTGSGCERLVAPEAEAAVSRALAISQSHPSLAPYGPALALLQLRLAVFSAKPPKYLRTLLRRLLASLPPIPSLSSSPFPSRPSGPTTSAAAAAAAAATYAAHALAAQLAGATLPEALAAWETVRELAYARGDDQVGLVATLAEARLALEVEDYPRCGGLLDIPHRRGTLDTPPAAAAAAAAETPPRLLEIQFRLLDCLYRFQLGDTKAAKDLLKVAHRLLDATVEGNAIPSDLVTTAVSGGRVGERDSSGDTATLHFQVAPQSTLYPFAFLVSAAIHLDPQGKTPRAQLFAEEGIRLAEQTLYGREITLPVPTLSHITASLARTAQLATRLHLLLAALATLRSDYARADRHLAAALHLARAYATPDAAEETTMRVALGWALVRTARAARAGQDEHEAARTLEAVLQAVRAANGAEPVGGGGGGGVTTVAAAKRRRHLERVAALTLLLVRLSASTTASARGSEEDHFLTPVDALVRAVVADSAASSNTTTAGSSSSSDPPPPLSSSAHTRLLSALAQALTVPSITASKTALSQALTLTNQMQATHARSGVLALLANVFLWTREGEAQKMLASALRLASSFGPPPPPPPPPVSAHTAASASTAASGPPPPAVPTPPTLPSVGNARLSLWLGERLLETYRASPQNATLVAAQERVNQACRDRLEQEERDARVAAGEA